MPKRKRATKQDAESPTASCLLICDEVFVATLRNKHTIQGIINAIAVPSFPAAIGPFSAYVRLSNVYGGAKVVLNFVNAATDEEIFRFETEAPKDSDPTGLHTLILQIPQFAVEAEGKYIFGALHAGVPFAQSPIMIRARPAPGENR